MHIATLFRFTSVPVSSMRERELARVPTYVSVCVCVCVSVCLCVCVYVCVLGGNKAGCLLLAALVELWPSRISDLLLLLSDRFP